MSKKTSSKNDAYVSFEVEQDLATGRVYALPDTISVAAYATQGASASDKIIAPVASEIPFDAATGWNWANWGDNDNRPNDYEDKVKDVATLGQAIHRHATATVSDMLVYCDIAEFRKPQTERTELANQDVEKFLKKTNYRDVILETVYQAFTHGQFFAVFTLDYYERKKILRIEILPCAFCRKSKQDPKSLRSEYLLYSKKFGNKYGAPRQSEIVPIPLLDKYDDYFFDKLKGTRFAVHYYLPTTSFFYYPTPPWHGLFKKDGWIDIASSVPLIIKAMQDNQMRVKYLIKISEDYFKMRYVNKEKPEEHWPTMTSENRRKIIDAKILDIETQLSSSKNAGKSIAYVYEQDAINPNNERGHITITAIEDKLKTGDWVPDVSEANNQIVLGMGVSGSVYGLQSAGGKMGAGSGSDKMQDRNIQISTNTIIQQWILSPIEYALDFNNFGVFPYFRDLILTTKDKSQNGIAPTLSPQNPS